MRGLASLPLMLPWLIGCPQDELPEPDSEVRSVQFVRLVADNEMGDVDENDQTEDWVELHNSGDAPVVLTGWTMTDDAESGELWTFPEVTLAAGDTLRVWCDNDPEDGDLHATFKLSKEGESLTLYDAAGDVADAITWGALQPDEVWERPE